MGNDFMKRNMQLDNIGKYYSSTSTSKNPNVFRFSCTLNEEVDRDYLEQSFNDCLELFPNFTSTLKMGTFWYYLEYNDQRYHISDKTDTICKKFDNSEGTLVRLMTEESKIILEVSHIVSDGLGTVKFFKTLISIYINMKYPSEAIAIYEDKEEFIKENYSDSYEKCKIESANNTQKSKRIYRYRSVKNKETTFLELHFKTNQLLELARQHNTTISTLLISCLIYAMYVNANITNIGSTIKIDVPVDLRKFFDSSTSRNFFGMTSIDYKITGFSDNLTDIIDFVSKEIKVKTKAENILPRVSSMLSLEKNFILSKIPIVLKDLILQIAGKVAAHNTSSCFSNVGKIDMPDNMMKYIQDFSVIASTGSFLFTCCSFENNFSLGISSVYKTNKVVKIFLDILANLGVESSYKLDSTDLKVIKKLQFIN